MKSFSFQSPGLLRSAQFFIIKCTVLLYSISILIVAYMSQVWVCGVKVHLGFMVVVFLYV